MRVKEGEGKWKNINLLAIEFCFRWAESRPALVSRCWIFGLLHIADATSGRERTRRQPWPPTRRTKRRTTTSPSQARPAVFAVPTSSRRLVSAAPFIHCVNCSPAQTTSHSNQNLFFAFSLPQLRNYVVGIFWQFGCGVEFLICLILTFCGYFPGVIYACIMIATDK